MAKVVFSAVVGDARNKAGGVVFSKSKAGAIIRRKVSPVQPRTSYQRNVRACFTALSKLWGDPSMDANRAGWITLAGNSPQTDVFGNTIYLTGLQMFQRCNRALQAIEEAHILVAPAALVCGSPGALTVTANVAAGTITVTNAVQATANEHPVCFAAPACGAGRKFIGNRCRQIVFGAAAQAGPFAVGQVYKDKYGAWAVGQRIFVELFFTRDDTGAQGGVSSADCIST